MRIGIDLDNTIAAYDTVFLRCALQRGLLPESFHGGKSSIRNAVRKLPDGEIQWQRLQTYVYGEQMARAELFPGVQAFLRECKKRRIPVHIISHKTEFANCNPQGANLRQVAWTWMHDHEFFTEHGLAIDPSHVGFYDSREEKVSAIAQAGCDVFIDDLPEVLLHPEFPTGVTKILFTPEGESFPHKALQVFSHWRDITHVVFG